MKEKYGVETDNTLKYCPICGAKLIVRGNILVCPNCGTAATEIGGNDDRKTKKEKK